MMPLWPLAALLCVLIVIFILEPVLIIYAYRSDVACREMRTEAQGEDAGGDLAVSPLQ
jgi:hypothetical protein